MIIGFIGIVEAEYNASLQKLKTLQAQRVMKEKDLLYGEQYKNALLSYKQHKYEEAYEVVASIYKAGYLKALPMYADLLFMGRGKLEKKQKEVCKLVAPYQFNPRGESFDYFEIGALYQVLGGCHYKGYSVKNDFKRAEYNFKTAAGHQHRSSNYCLGLLARGRDLQERPDVYKAVKFYEKSIENESEDGAYELAFAYQQGVGALQDPSEGLKYYLMSYKWGNYAAGCPAAEILMDKNYSHLRSKYNIEIKDIIDMVRGGHRYGNFGKEYCQSVWNRHGLANLK
jgi:TPR repeat protein